MGGQRRGARSGRETAVPAAMRETFATLAALTDRVCQEHLSEQYADLARRALAALSRKRPSPLTRGRADVWACAVVYALGQVNFLSDRSQKPHMTSEELCRLFGVAPSTALNKARQVREMLGMSPFDHRWMLLGLRVFKVADFWISTGVLAPTGLSILRQEPGSAAKPRAPGKPAIDTNQLAEEMYRGTFGRSA